MDSQSASLAEMTDEERREEKLKAFTERQQQRQAEIEKRRAQRLDGADPSEDVQAFFDAFKSRRAEIQAGVEAARGIKDRVELTKEFDRLLKAVRELQQYLSESVRFLPSYDVQSSQKQIDALGDLIGAAQDELMPKKKFAFKARRQRVAEEPAVERANISVAPMAVSAPAANKLVVSGEEGSTIRMGDVDVRGKDVEISGLKGCRVELAGQPNAFHIRDLVDCTVLIGPVSRSLLISDCSKCRFWIACQQLRVHTTTDTDFYLHVTSKAIIEDCSRVRFAPYTWDYPGIDADYAASGLNRSRNEWNHVDDFKWLNPNAPSPNWRVLAEDERAAP